MFSWFGGGLIKSLIHFIRANIDICYHNSQGYRKKLIQDSLYSKNIKIRNQEAVPFYQRTDCT